MRHNVKGRKLSRTASHRRALFANLTSQLIEHKTIETTTAKAKEARGYVEKMITLAKKGDLNSVRQAIKFLRHKDTVYALFHEIAPMYKERNGGYTRVLKIGFRKGDSAETAMLQLVGFESFKKDKRAAAAALKAEKPVEAAQEA